MDRLEVAYDGRRIGPGLAGSGLADPFAFRFTIVNVLEELPERFMGIKL